jgi:PAS domain S-box-containing protein
MTHVLPPNVPPHAASWGPVTLFSLEDGDRLAMLQSLKTCIILHEASTKNILWANQAACEALGFTVEELLPLKAPDMTRKAEKYRHEIGRQWLETAAQDGESIIEWCYRAKDGTEILSEAVATRVSLHDRDAIMVQFRDIAAEERIKKDLKRLETRLKEFMQDLGEGIAVLATDGTIKYLSESSCRLLGLPTDGEPPQNFFAFCHEADSLLVARRLHQAGMEMKPSSLRYRVHTANGTLRWHDTSCRFVELDDDLSGVMLHIRDVTEQVAEHEARRLNERKLEYLARYNAMGEMAMTISHELSQPLASARNFIEGGMLRLKSLPHMTEDIMWGMGNVLKQVERASLIIKSVRDYVVKVEQADEKIDINAIVNEVFYFISLRARESGVRVETDLEQTSVMVVCEKILIGQVILNLAFNAIEAMQETAAVNRVLRIETQKTGDAKVLVRVSDRGPGLDIGVKERVFDGFFTSKTTGNGIGLSLCKNIIARHGGDVWVEANAPQGTLFVFSLPLAGAQAA